jgi:hypothetical protein
MSMAATRSVGMPLGRGDLVVRALSVVSQSAVISVTAARAEDSSTMAFLAA